MFSVCRLVPHPSMMIKLLDLSGTECNITDIASNLTVSLGASPPTMIIKF